MSKWPTVPLSEILTERQEFPSEFALINGAIPILSKIGFNDGVIQLRKETQTKTNMILVRPGDIVISGINATKGAVAVYEENNLQPIAATIHYTAYIPNKNRIDPYFIWWLLRSNTFQDLLSKYLPGGIKTELKAKRLLPIPIPLPSPSQQQLLLRKIRFFSANFEESRKNHIQSAAISKSLMESCLQKIMSRFNQLTPFGNVLSFNPRSGPSFPTNPDWPGTPVLMPSAVTGFGINTAKVEFGLGNETLSSKDMIDEGDILIARGNKRDQVGNAGVVPKEAKGWTYANLLMKLKVDITKVDQRFCIYWLRSPLMRNHVKTSMTGTNPNIQKINQQTILNFPFPENVSLSEQQGIVAYLDEIQGKLNDARKLQSKTADELNALLPSILDKAFKGEL